MLLKWSVRPPVRAFQFDVSFESFVPATVDLRAVPQAFRSTHKPVVELRRWRRTTAAVASMRCMRVVLRWEFLPSEQRSSRKWKIITINYYDK